jgi:glycine betaine/proline transport system ATP-binding protein
MSQLRVEGLTKIFGDRPERALEALQRGMSKDEVHAETGQVVAVRDVTFEVDQGELFVVMGLSGSGKSTVVRMLNRLIEPTSGSVEIDGEDVLAMSSEELRKLRMSKISMVFQHFALFPHRTVRANAAYGLKVQGVGEDERNERAERSLERVGLGGWGDSMPFELSGGMQQRVGLARGLATDADILLMDEPFSALDPLIRRDMQDLLGGLQEELHKTIIFITHDLNEAMRLGDRIVVMKDGAVVQIGTGEEIIHDPSTQYVADFVADVDRSRVLTAQLAMREPRRTFPPDAHPRDVLAWLDDAEVNGVYVLDAQHKILGVARDDRVARGLQEGATEVRSLLLDDYASVALDTPLNALTGLAAQHTVPLAVTDEHGHLLGVVRRATLLATISGEDLPQDPEVSLDA